LTADSVLPRSEEEIDPSSLPSEIIANAKVTVWQGKAVDTRCPVYAKIFLLSKRKEGFRTTAATNANSPIFDYIASFELTSLKSKNIYYRAVMVLPNDPLPSKRDSPISIRSFNIELALMDSNCNANHAHTANACRLVLSVGDVVVQLWDDSGIKQNLLGQVILPISWLFEKNSIGNILQGMG
jgi:hypothetical protein